MDRAKPEKSASRTSLRESGLSSTFDAKRRQERRLYWRNVPCQSPEMKRRELVRHLQEHGCVLLREGAAHSVWTNPANGRSEAVPRHTEVKKHLARHICRGLSVPVPKGA